MTEAEILDRYERLTAPGWQFLWRRCPVAHAMLRQWMHTPTMTLKDVAQAYSRHQWTALEKVLDFNPEALRVAREGWPEWREQSPNICDEETYQEQEAQRICAEIYATLCGAMAYRRTREELNARPSITVTTEQAKALGFDV